MKKNKKPDIILQPNQNKNQIKNVGIIDRFVSFFKNTKKDDICLLSDQDLNKSLKIVEKGFRNVNNNNNNNNNNINKIDNNNKRNLKDSVNKEEIIPSTSQNSNNDNVIYNQSISGYKFRVINKK